MSQANARTDIDARAKTENNSCDGIHQVAAEAKVQISLPNNIVVDLDEDEWDDDFLKAKTKGKLDKVTVTPTRPKAANEPREAVVNKGDTATPKSDKKPGATVVNKGDDDKKSQEEGKGKSTPPFQLKIKPGSK